MGDRGRLYAGRAVRGGVDGLVSVLLASYLARRGLDPAQIGVVVTGTLLGSAALTLAVGLTGHRHPPRTVLLAACALMAATGLGFAAAGTFATLLAVGVLGTLNPSAGDVSVFLPTEQAALADLTTAADRPGAYARYNLAGAVAGAAGALAAAVMPERTALVVYAAAACVIAVLYLGLERHPPDARPPRTGLRESRQIVLRLSALFSLDAGSSGFVVQALLVLWLRLRFGLEAPTMAATFAAAGLLGGASQLLSGRLAARIGLVPTMVLTHLPANALLVATAFAPDAPTAIALLLTRALFAQMDVPARQAFVMAAVTPGERAAAASVTNVPRSLASALTPAASGWFLARGWLAWPLVIAGTGKIVYDLLLLRAFRHLPNERLMD